MKNRTAVLAFLLVASTYASVVSWQPALAESHDEIFPAGEILPKEILVGRNYRILDTVSVKENMYVFRVDSDFGQFEAESRDVLDLRLHELKSIEAAKELAKDVHVVDDILTPLENTGKGVGLLIQQPLETVGSMPQGFGLMVSQLLDPADRRAGSLPRRKLAAELDCDPETRNPVLKKLLDGMSLQESGGGFLTKAAMSFVPGLSVLPMTAETKEMIANNPPHVINSQIDKKLEAAGVDKSVRSRFCKSKAFTTAQRILLMEQFEGMEAVSGRASLIEAATYADTEAEALAVIRAGKMIVDLNKRQAVRELTFVGLPLAVLDDGTHIIICPFDYVMNTEELIEGVHAYRTAYRQAKAIMLTTGGVSAAARKTLEAAGIGIVAEDIAGNRR
jgi:hypothetical protein